MGTFARSIDDLVSELRVRLDDDATTDTEASVYFTDAQYRQAIRDAIEELQDRIFTLDEYQDSDFDGTTFTAGDRHYDIPMYVERVLRVQRQIPPKDASTDDPEGVISPWLDVPFRQTRDVGTQKNELYSPDSYPDLVAFRIRYERHIPIPPANDQVQDDPLSDSATTLTIGLAGADPAYEWDVPMYFRIENEIVRATATSGTTDVTIERGQMGTTAASHVQNSDVEPMIVTRTRQEYSLIRDQALIYLYHAAIQDGNESRASIWITLYDQAMERIQRKARHNSSRREPGYLQANRRRKRRGVL